MTDQTVPQPHSIEALVASVATREAKGGESISFDDDAIETISEAIDEIPDNVELVDAVNTLVAIAHVLEVEAKSPKAARQILDIVEKQSLLDRLSELLVVGGLAQREALEKSTDKLTGGNNESSGQIAHKLAQPAPSGAKKLSEIVPTPLALAVPRPRQAPPIKPLKNAFRPSR
jgi:hypothetical protein